MNFFGSISIPLCHKFKNNKMKRLNLILLVSTVSLLFSTNTQAQGAFEGGVRVGVNSSNVSEASGATITYGLGSQIGVYARYGGIFYGQIGFDYFDNNIGAEINQTKEKANIKFNTINPALIIGFKLMDTESAKMRAYLGSSFQALVNFKDNSFYQREDLRKSYTVYQVGLGFELSRFTLDFKYESSINTFFDNTGSILTNDTEAHFNRFTTSIGYRIF